MHNLHIKQIVKLFIRRKTKSNVIRR